MFPEEYIRQCEKAVEVQEYYWKNYWELLPCFIHESTLNEICIEFWVPSKLKAQIRSCPDTILTSINRKNDQRKKIREPKKGNTIWLPTQAPLQKIFKIDCQIVHLKSGQIELSYNSYDGNEVSEDFDSIEQGLLCAGMHQKYNKTWTGADWQPAGEG
jgi:hypothetical protein